MAIPWKNPPYYSYRTCGTVLNPPALNERDEQRRRSVVNGLKVRLANLEYLTDPEYNGIFGQSLRRALIDWQIDEGLKVTGVLDRASAKKFAEPLVKLEQMGGEPGIPIPHNYLAGQFALESNWDPGAYNINEDTGTMDRGWPQINDGAFDIPDHVAFGDWATAIEFGANQLRNAKRRQSDDETYAEQDRWDCAILNHNHPVGADYLYDTGTYKTYDDALYVWLVADRANRPW